MGNITKAEKEKRKTKATIIKALQDKEIIQKSGKDEKYLLDQVDQYMEFFENLEQINEELTLKFDADLVKEKRLIAKEMRNILTFLGLKPSVGLGVGEPEDL